jgi:osmotically-inducible protein OsmY
MAPASTTGIDEFLSQTDRRGAVSRPAFQLNAPPQLYYLQGKTMKYARAIAFAALAGITIISTGCAVGRGQQTAGSFVDDSAITTAVKAKYAADKTVSAMSISVETLNGTVQLSGFAKSAAEKSQAETIARDTKNVRAVRNDIVVRP